MISLDGRDALMGMEGSETTRLCEVQAQQEFWGGHAQSETERESGT